MGQVNGLFWVENHAGFEQMKEIYSSFDPVEVSYVQAMLKERDIPVFTYDQNMGAVYNHTCLFPSRLMVIDEDFMEARKILIDLEKIDQLDASDDKR